MEEVTIEIGEQYVYDHAPYQILLVTILEDVTDGDLIGWLVRVDEVLGGLIPPQVGAKFRCTYTSGFEHYTGWKLKPKPPIILH